MSYSEKDGQVVLTIDALDWQILIVLLGRLFGSLTAEERPAYLSLINRLNEGNPNFTPYEVTEKS